MCNCEKKNEIKKLISVNQNKIEALELENKYLNKSIAREKLIHALQLKVQELSNLYNNLIECTEFCDYKKQLKNLEAEKEIKQKKELMINKALSDLEILKAEFQVFKNQVEELTKKRNVIL